MTKEVQATMPSLLCESCGHIWKIKRIQELFGGHVIKCPKCKSEEWKPLKNKEVYQRVAEATLIPAIIYMWGKGHCEGDAKEKEKWEIP